MSKIGEGILKGLNEAVEYSKGNLKLNTNTVFIPDVKEFSADEVKRLRQELGYSQGVFANILGVSNKTIEAWESGKNIPSGPASRILDLLSKDPQLPEKMGMVYNS